MTKSKSLHFRPFLLSDREACLAVFDTNCPEFFAPNERRDYERFLAGNPSTYVVCIRNHKIVGAYGFKISSESRRGCISWIMVDASARGNGLGTRMICRVLEAVSSGNTTVIDIAASQKSAPFFARFGAVEINRTLEGWGPGLDRVDMKLTP